MRLVSYDLTCPSNCLLAVVYFQGGQRVAASDLTCRVHHTLHSPLQLFCGTSMPHTQTKSQNTFNGGAVELTKYVAVEAKLPQLPKEVEALLCFLQDGITVDIP